MASTFTSLLTQIVRPYNISTDNAGYLGGSFIIAGLVGAALTGIFIDKTGRHKIVIKTYVPIVGALYLAFYFVGKKKKRLSVFLIYTYIFLIVKTGNFGSLVAICILMGFFTFSLLPVALELSIESSYPISESISSSMLWMCSQVLGLIFLAVIDALRNPDGTYTRGLLFTVCAIFPVSIIAMIYNSPNKRLEFEKRNIGTS